MVINFDEYKEGEDITIICDGIAKTYKNPKVIFQRHIPLVIPPYSNMHFQIKADEVIESVNVEILSDYCKMCKA